MQKESVRGLRACVRVSGPLWCVYVSLFPSLSLRVYVLEGHRGPGSWIHERVRPAIYRLQAYARAWKLCGRTYMPGMAVIHQIREILGVHGPLSGQKQDMYILPRLYMGYCLYPRLQGGVLSTGVLVGFGWGEMPCQAGSGFGCREVHRT